MEDILSQLNVLEGEYKDAETFEQKLDIKDKILEIKREAGLIKPPDSPYSCEGCSG